jgi:hypothetical protein
METELGMPTPNTPEFNTWFDENGLTGVTRFFVSHPGYVLEKLARDFPDAFKQGVQAYYTIPEIKYLRARLTSFGQSLHTETATPFLMGSLLLFGIFLSVLNRGSETSQPWAWISAFLFLTASITIIPTILGDTWALHRHTIFSIMIFRLSLWVFAIIMIDITLQKEPAKI